MKSIYIVMSDELLDDDEWHTDTCRAFATAKEAAAFKVQLQGLYRENKHFENVTRFYVKVVPFGAV
jgi:hypothetical protein